MHVMVCKKTSLQAAPFQGMAWGSPSKQKASVQVMSKKLLMLKSGCTTNHTVLQLRPSLLTMPGLHWVIFRKTSVQVTLVYVMTCPVQAQITDNAQPVLCGRTNRQATTVHLMTCGITQTTSVQIMSKRLLMLRFGGITKHHLLRSRPV